MAKVWRRRSVTGKRRRTHTDDDRLFVLQLYGRGVHDAAPGQPQVPGLSTREVARMVGMSKSTVYYIVNPTYAERHRERRRLRYLENHDEELARRRLYSLEHPEEAAAYKRRWRRENPEQRRAQKRRDHLAHPEQRRAEKRRYRQAHPEQRRAEKRRWWARRRVASRLEQRS